MFKMLSMLIIVCTLISKSYNSYANDKIIVKHAQVESRYSFGVQLLKLALSKVGSYEVKGPDNQYINEARLDTEVAKGNIDLEFLSTTEKRESELIPIKIPVYRGLLGLRLLLVKNDKLAHLNKVKTLTDLREFIGGHGTHWKDLPVYAANKLPVKPEISYKQIFVLLKKGRVDYFHRGITEIWDEYNQHSKELSIVDNLMLFYSHPVYFFVSKKRPNLAKNLEKGLKIAITDGSYKKIFIEHFGESLKKAKLETRALIILKNPVTPKSALEIDTSWWVPGKYVKLIKEY